MATEKRPPESQDLTGDGLADARSGTRSAGAETESAASVDTQPETEAGAPTNEMQADLDHALAEIADLSNRLIRAQADFENYRRRMTREKEEMAVYANQKLLLKFLPVLDNLERALGAPKVEGDDKLRQGVELTARSFRDALTAEGLVTIEAVGQPFDPNLHEAVMTVESTDHEDGTVVMELQKGYRLGDRVIRPTMVQVSKQG